MADFYKELSDKEIDEIFDHNAMVLIEDILIGLAEHRNTALFEPHPYNKTFNLKVQELVKKYRNQIEL